MKVGSLIKCNSETNHPPLFGVIVKFQPAPVPESVLEDPECLDCRGKTSNEWFEDADTCKSTWAVIQWHDGKRTWEEMECSLEHNFEVVG